MKKIKKFLEKYKIYNSLDDFLKRNNIEVLSVKNRVAARWNSYNFYKSSSQSVSQTNWHQLTGLNYQDLSDKLKEFLLKNIRFSFSSLSGSLMGVLGIFVGINQSEFFYIIVGALLFLTFSFIFVTDAIEYVHTIKILKSSSNITIDYIKPNFKGFGTLFQDVLYPKKTK
jgi:hypothetical protein